MNIAEVRRDETTETPHNWRLEQGSQATMQYCHCLLYWPGLIHVATEVTQWEYPKSTICSCRFSGGSIRCDFGLLMAIFWQSGGYYGQQPLNGKLLIRRSDHRSDHFFLIRRRD